MKQPTILWLSDRIERQGAYERIRTRANEHAAPRITQNLDAETKERMRALGYDH